MYIRWSDEKNNHLKQKFGFGFERVLVALSDGKLLDDRRHVNYGRYPHQRQLIVQIDDYVFVVPYVETEDGVFLKTLFPSRKATRDYLERQR